MHKHKYYWKDEIDHPEPGISARYKLSLDTTSACKQCIVRITIIFPLLLSAWRLCYIDTVRLESQVSRFVIRFGIAQDQRSHFIGWTVVDARTISLIPEESGHVDVLITEVDQRSLRISRSRILYPSIHQSHPSTQLKAKQANSRPKLSSSTRTGRIILAVPHNQTQSTEMLSLSSNTLGVIGGEAVLIGDMPV